MLGLCTWVGTLEPPEGALPILRSLHHSRLPPTRAGFALESWVGSKAKPASDFFISPGTEVT